MTANVESLWIRRYNPIPDCDVRLVCFPHAGGSASYFRKLSWVFGPAVEVLAVQYPGRQDRWQEPLIDNVVELAERSLEELRPSIDRPVALFGHSMGASVAFEVARRLERSGIEPAWLIASGRTSPTRPREDTVHLLSDSGLLAEMSRTGGTDMSLLQDEEILRMVMPALRNDYKAAETYRYSPGPLLNCPITALVGREDPKATVEQADAWREVTTGPFDLRDFDGGHFYLSAWPDDVVDVLSRTLTTIVRRESGIA